MRVPTKLIQKGFEVILVAIKDFFKKKIIETRQGKMKMIRW